jgi:hypothetical protein
MRILAISGSLRSTSANTAALQIMKKLSLPAVFVALSIISNVYAQAATKAYPLTIIIPRGPATVELQNANWRKTTSEGLAIHSNGTLHIDWPENSPTGRILITRNPSGVRIDMVFETAASQRQVTISFSGLAFGVNPQVIFHGNKRTATRSGNYTVFIALP